MIVAADIRDVGAAESPVDYGECRESVKCFPDPDAGTSDKENGIVRCAVLLIPVNEIADFSFEAGGIWIRNGCLSADMDCYT